MIYIKLLFLITFTFITVNFNLVGQTPAQIPQAGKQVCLPTSWRGRIIDYYWVYLPREYNRVKRWPIILFLQGSDGISADSTTSKNDGPVKYALLDNQNPELNRYVKDSFIIVNPHMRPGGFWDRQWYQQYSAMDLLLDTIIKNYSGDSNRIYLTGLSRGGAGTWGIGQILNKRITAMIPISGSINGVTDFSVFNKIPIWIAHNFGDIPISYQESLNAVNKIEAITGVPFLRLNTAAPKNETYLKSKYILTTFEKDGHDAWSTTYDKVEIYKWLLNQKR